MGDDNYRTAMLDAVEQDGRLVELVLPQDSGFAPRLFGVEEHGALWCQERAGHYAASPNIS